MPTTPPEITCRILPEFDSENLAATIAAFKSCETCTMSQSWQPTLDPDFQPAVVKVGWQNFHLLVLTQLHDNFIHSNASAHNQHMWQLGDVLEIFLQSGDAEEYIELHVTPNHYHLQLRFPNSAAVSQARKTKNFDPFLLAEDSFASQIWLDPDHNQWFVLAEIPAALVTKNVSPLPGQIWKFSLSRYDAGPPEHPAIISSTSPHARADFHSRAEWGTLQFTP